MIFKGKEMRVVIADKEYHCAVDVAMGFIGGKWKAVILWYLRKDAQRFGELRKLMPGITEKMLSMQLRQLEKDGIVQRKVFAEVPPRVEYSLTDMGKNMVPMLEKIAEWGRAMAVRFGETVEMPLPK
jgi:DNA-binding HxlR family transcriptional regulator